MKLVIRTLILLWILPLTLEEGKDAVHTFYDNKDQLKYQFEAYKGRTSLFPETEIKNGNVSLMLKNIKIQDEGRYRCYTASDQTNEETYVAMSVLAPVKSVDITLRDDTVICNTSGVYPEPDVLWFTDPLAKDQLNNYNTTDENLFTVTSEIKRGYINNNYTYNCSITNKDRTKTHYSVSLIHREISVRDEVTLPCRFTKDFNYILTVNFSITVLKYDSQTFKKQISDQFEGKVDILPDGTVRLHNLNTEQHLGTYICESSTAESRYIVHTVIKQDARTHTALIVLSVLAVITTVIICVVVILRKRKQRKK
ncbi:HERV-H LTR-associating protein 2 isoform X2 [Myxocyprinus asiaticus]|uniref:HERV-H LTR-associating protein 2 isoform X2 n=1 Tax=Myxocyprinus asiaticus TaxID=70543 RepID=UPI002222C3BB|nr:HERV-H LTR-associating protein 2 isoform X2 [Myxocyprinus asiaticus]